MVSPENLTSTFTAMASKCLEDIDVSCSAQPFPDVDCFKHQRIIEAALHAVAALVEQQIADDPDRYKGFKARIAALQREQDANWQPIETAPKDRSYIVLRELNYQAGAVIGKWFDFGQPIHGETGFWEAHATEVHPSGWMPLPAAAIRATPETPKPSV